MAEDLAVLSARLTHLAEGVERMETILAQMSESLNKLSIVEERQATAAETVRRLYDKLDTLEERLRTLEIAEPIQSQTSQWIINGVWGIVGAIGAYLVAKLLGR